MLSAPDLASVPCQVISNHPSLGGKPLSWTASLERVETDILAIHNYIPRLDEIPTAADGCGRFQRSVIVDDDYNGVVDSEIRRCASMKLGSPDDPSELTLMGLLLSTVEGQFLRAYFGGVNPHATVRVGSGYDLLRYQPGGFYNEHCDVVHDHPVLGHRRLSLVLFVNNDFDGGELYFPRQDTTVKPEKGKAVIFPSGITHPHQVRPVLKGTRYTVVSWFF